MAQGEFRVERQNWARGPRVLQVNRYTDGGTETRRYLPERHEEAWDERKYAVGKIAELQAENAKLRTFLGGGSIVTYYWKDEDGTMHVLTTDGEHTYEYMRGGLADENAKLREELEAVGTAAYLYGRTDLADENAKLRELVRFIMHQCNDGNPRCDECIGWNDGECVALLRMRELGVEVTE